MLVASIMTVSTELVGVFVARISNQTNNSETVLETKGIRDALLFILF